MSCANRSMRYVTHLTAVEDAQYHESVVRLSSLPGKASEEGDGRIIATGFAIDSDHLVTAGHFCKDVRKLEIAKKASDQIALVSSSHDGSLYLSGQATILAISDTYDLCLLFSEGHGIVPLPLADDMSMVETENKVTVIGAPANFFPVRREGHVIARRAGNLFRSGPHMLLLAIDIQGGSSGSPVLMGGEVIGVVVILPYKIHNAGLAEGVDVLHEFLDKNINNEE